MQTLRDLVTYVLQRIDLPLQRPKLHLRTHDFGAYFGARQLRSEPNGLRSEPAGVQNILGLVCARNASSRPQDKKQARRHHAVALLAFENTRVKNTLLVVPLRSI